MTNLQTDEHSGHSFLLGFLAGGVLGASLSALFGPRLAVEARRAADAARTLRKTSAERYQHASATVGSAVSDLAAQGRGLRDDVRNAVARQPKEGKAEATK